jgi:hypothetical protein
MLHATGKIPIEPMILRPIIGGIEERPLASTI